jgi:WhiB family redox-sensing transcriptional regulator
VRTVVSVADLRRLPIPVTTIWDWQLSAACRGIDSAVFFHPENERGPAKNHRNLRAKQVCAGCPVIQACRQHALDVHEPYGVWGGMTVAEREALLRHPTQLDLA